MRPARSADLRPPRTQNRTHAGRVGSSQMRQSGHPLTQPRGNRLTPTKRDAGPRACGRRSCCPLARSNASQLDARSQSRVAGTIRSHEATANGSRSLVMLPVHRETGHWRPRDVGRPFWGMDWPLRGVEGYLGSSHPLMALRHTSNGLSHAFRGPLLGFLPLIEGSWQVI